ncbi:hypothetical protein CEXT_254501 [Caerostris extrusa]|uniref:Uncharacterized protein n=1 Tax=Caerostris extrusa TaxID=172846 RepID=A0AAV4T121_CAEEX|nr:hypothetical protein CEXT_254501 [Caerostris extrusa]
MRINIGHILSSDLFAVFLKHLGYSRIKDVIFLLGIKVEPRRKLRKKSSRNKEPVLHTRPCHVLLERCDNMPEYRNALLRQLRRTKTIKKIKKQKASPSNKYKNSSTEKREECSVKESDKSVKKTSPVLYSFDVYMEIFRAYLKLFKTKTIRRRLTAFLTERNFDEYFLIYKKDTSLELVPNKDLVRWILKSCKKSKHIEKQWALVHEVLNVIDSEVVLKIGPENRKNWIEVENSNNIYFKLLLKCLGSRDAEHKKHKKIPMKKREFSFPGRDSQIETSSTQKSPSFIIPTQETPLPLAAENERPLKHKKRKHRHSLIDINDFIKPNEISVTDKSTKSNDVDTSVPIKTSVLPDLPLVAENERPLKHKKRKHRHSLIDDNAFIKLNDISVTDKSTQSNDVDTSVPIKTSVLPDLPLVAENERPLKHKKRKHRHSLININAFIKLNEISVTDKSTKSNDVDTSVPIKTSVLPDLPLVAENERPLKHKKRKHRHSLIDINDFIKLNEISVKDKSTQSNDVDTSVPIKTSILPDRHCHVNLIRYDETPEFKKFI